MSLRRKLCFLCNTVSVSGRDTFSGNREGCERDLARVIHVLGIRGQIMRWQAFFAIPVAVSALNCTSGCHFAGHLRMDAQAMGADCGDWASQC